MVGVRTCWYSIHRGKSAGRKLHAESDTWCSRLFVFLEHSRTVSSEKTGRKGLVSDEPQTPKRLQNSQRIGIIATPRVGNIRLTPPCLARRCHSFAAISIQHHKACPIIWLRIDFLQFVTGLVESGFFGHARQPKGVEFVHHRLCYIVRNVPQRHDNRFGAGKQQSATIEWIYKRIGRGHIARQACAPRKKFLLTSSGIRQTNVDIVATQT